MSELVQTFSLAVMEQEEEIKHGTAFKGNRAAIRYINAFNKLRTLYGDQGREALKGLLHHEDEAVRCTAAAYLLRYCTNEAMAVLKELAVNGKGFTLMDAFYCLKNWKDGTWTLDPEPSAADEGGGDGCKDR